jgi:hypothetical protein
MEIQHENRRREEQSKREEFERIISESIKFAFFFNWTLTPKKRMEWMASTDTNSVYGSTTGRNNNVAEQHKIYPTSKESGFVCHNTMAEDRAAATQMHHLTYNYRDSSLGSSPEYANKSTNRSHDQAQQIGSNVDNSNESRLLQSDSLATSVQYYDHIYS